MSRPEFPVTIVVHFLDGGEELAVNAGKVLRVTERAVHLGGSVLVFADGEATTIAESPREYAAKVTEIIMTASLGEATS